MPTHPHVLVIGKSIVAALWIVTGSAFFLSGDSLLLEAGRLTFAVTALAHVVECAIFFPTLKASSSEASRGLATNLLLTLVFGVFHYATLKFEALAREQREAHPPVH